MKFKYKALQDGKIKSAQAEADSEEKLVAYLKTKDLTIIEVEQTKQSSLSVFMASFSRIGFNDVVNLTRKIAMMLNAGLTIVDTLEILKKQTTKPALITLIEQIDEDVRAGSSLSGALQQHKKLFSNLYISLVKAGEASGKLDEILLKLADDLDKQREFRGKLKGALMYPAIILVAMLIVMFIMVTFVIPQLLNLYKDFNINLPATTRALMILSDFFQKTWILIVVGAIAGVAALKRYLATRSGKRAADALILKTPVISKIIRISALVDATRTLAILIESGVSILESLQIVIETTTNIIYQEAFETVYKDVEKGQSFGKALDSTGVFPPILVQMAGVGEQTGNLDDTLKRISRYFEMESTMSMKALTTLIEPTILVILGIFVGFLVMSVITPIYQLTSSF